MTAKTETLSCLYVSALAIIYSEKWEIPTNLMFIGSPGTHFIYGLADLGGVRLIV